MTVSAPATPPTPESLVWAQSVVAHANALIRSDAPTSSLAQNFSRYLAGVNGAVLSSGRVSAVGMYLPAGMVVSNIIWVSATTAGGTLTNQWAFIADASRVMVARSADGTSGAWAANTAKTFAIAQIASGASSTYTIPTTAFYYVGLMVAATTVPTLLSAPAAAITTGLNLAPILSGTSNTGMTTPPGFPTTFNALTVAGTPPYVYLT